jgi:hypothetical protein
MVKHRNLRQSPFEQHWRERLLLATNFLRDVQDYWLQTSLPFPTQNTAAVILQIFAFDFFSESFKNFKDVQSRGLWRRSIPEWFASVSGVESELARLCPAVDRSECLDVASEICKMLDLAAESWAKHSSVQPSCDVVVHNLLDLLVARHFANTYYGT